MREQRQDEAGRTQLAPRPAHGPVDLGVAAAWLGLLRGGGGAWGALTGEVGVGILEHHVNRALLFVVVCRRTSTSVFAFVVRPAPSHLVPRQPSP
jgi:hypothetical protein